MSMLRTLIVAALCTLAGRPALASPPPPGNQVRPGDFYVEPPTLINLGFEWRIEGDDNRNAKVDVWYRQKGTAQWKQGMPLLRLSGERVLSNVRFDVISPNMFSGSILDLQPNTDYECRFVLSDPDGIGRPAPRGRLKGSHHQGDLDYRVGPDDVQVTVIVHTRPEPVPYAGGRVFHVYPHGTPDAVKIEPAFEGLLAAYNNSSSGTDMTMATRPRVRPGDTILVHAGVYKYHPEFYTNTASLSRVPFDGTYYLHGNGTPDKPIAIKAAGDGEVVFDGNGAFNLFNVKNADYAYFEGLTFRNTEIAIWAGDQFGSGAKGLTVKRCRFENIGMGVYTNSSRSSNFYIADNWFIGRNDPDHIISWSNNSFANFLGIPFPPSMGSPSIDTRNGTWLSNGGVPYAPQYWYGSYIAVKTYGPGHVFAYNYVAHFHDGIDNETYGNPDGSFATDPNLPDTTDGPKYPPEEYWDRRPVALDFYNNYMTNFHDNPFEADGSMHNVRFLRNFIVNTASHGYCNQPVLGGPIYWIRNVQYHAPGGSTRGELTGAVFYNNTTLTETSATASSNMHWRNNLMLGENALDAIFSVTTNTNYTSSDYNGFRVNPGVATSFAWNSPPFDVLSDQPAPATPTTPAHTPVRVARPFATLADYSAATGQDTHSVLLDYDVFVNVPKFDARDNVQRTTVIDPQALGIDFRLRPGSVAVDRGTFVPNVTDAFIGAAPDLGALELGEPLPHWGPRE